MAYSQNIPLKLTFIAKLGNSISINHSLSYLHTELILEVLADLKIHYLFTNDAPTAVLWVESSLLLIYNSNLQVKENKFTKHIACKTINIILQQNFLLDPWIWGIIIYLIKLKFQINHPMHFFNMYSNFKALYIRRGYRGVARVTVLL